MPFIGEEFFLRPARAALFLFLDLPLPFLRRALFVENFLLDLLDEEPSRQKSIERLAPLYLALDLNSGRDMFQDHARGDLVDILPARARRAHEMLRNVALIYPQTVHLEFEVFDFGGRYWHGAASLQCTVYGVQGKSI